MSTPEESFQSTPRVTDFPQPHDSAFSLSSNDSFDYGCGLLAQIRKKQVFYNDGNERMFHPSVSAVKMVAGIEITPQV